MAESWDAILTFVQDHERYILPLAFAICMAESIVGLSLLVPSTVILISASAMFGASGVNLLTLWLVAGLGAALGDWVSYGLGYYAEERLHDHWPFRENPDFLIRGHQFFERWGWLSMFIARFMGPLRSVTPLIAGTFKMPLWQFALASTASALVWAAAVLAPGGLGAGWLLGR